MKLTKESLTEMVKEVMQEQKSWKSGVHMDLNDIITHIETRAKYELEAAASERARDRKQAANRASGRAEAYEDCYWMLRDVLARSAK